MKNLRYTGIFVLMLLYPVLNRAQSIELHLSNGDLLPNGSEVYAWGDTGYYTQISATLQLKNISSSTINCKVKKIIIDTLSGSTNSMCFAGQCYLSGTYVSLKADTIEPGGTDPSFSGDYKSRGHLGESKIMYVFFKTADPNDSAWVTIRYNATPLSVEENPVMIPEISNPYPNPADHSASITYKLPKNTQQAGFVLQDIVGSKINDKTIYDLDGKVYINTSELKEGIYFYSFFINGKLYLTRKLIVKH